MYGMIVLIKTIFAKNHSFKLIIFLAHDQKLPKYRT